MEISISKNKTLQEIQNEFAKRFPFLKIEFYKQAHQEGKGSPKKNTLNNELTIGAVQNVDSTGTIKINGLMKVSEIEKAFVTVFGLPVQVFRKSGDVWLQTTATDDWTLAEQNQNSMEKSQPSKESYEPMDYREQE